MSGGKFLPDEEAMEVAWIEFEGSDDDINEASAEFNRFVAEVRACALRDAADLVPDANAGVPFDHDHDLAIVAAWLDERADTVQKEAGL